jgi:dTDP-glucose 4,6-dehydratase
MAQLRMRHLLLAGGAGFLGAAFARERLRADSEVEITALDSMRRPSAEREIADLLADRRFRLVKGDVCHRSRVEELASAADAIVNFASEEFVGGAAADAPAFARTDIEGTAILLEAARKFRHQRFLLVSSMEVYGPRRSAPNREDDPPAPRTLPAAARAAACMLARAYHSTHGLPILITRGVSAYGPQQPAGQPVARMISSALRGEPLWIEGNGSAARDYLFVEDHVSAIARVLWKGEPGGTYNIGSGSHVTGNELADMILRLCGQPLSLKRHARDTSSWSYAVDARRMRPLGWEPRTSLNDGLRLTVDWYRQQQSLRTEQVA